MPSAEASMRSRKSLSMSCLDTSRSDRPTRAVAKMATRPNVRRRRAASVTGLGACPQKVGEKRGREPWTNRGRGRRGFPSHRRGDATRRRPARPGRDGPPGPAPCPYCGPKEFIPTPPNPLHRFPKRPSKLLSAPPSAWDFAPATSHPARARPLRAPTPASSAATGEGGDPPHTLGLAEGEAEPWRGRLSARR